MSQSINKRIRAAGGGDSIESTAAEVGASMNAGSLIVNATGGLVYEMTGSAREATRKAERIEAKRCDCLATVPEPEHHDRMCPKYIAWKCGH